MEISKCERCFHFHSPSEECFKHNIPRHSKDKCYDYSEGKRGR